MTDKKLTALTDAGSLASGDTGDVLYVVNNAGNSRQAKLGSLKTIAAGDTGVIIPNFPSDVLAEASDTGALVKLTDNKFASQWAEHNLLVNSHFQVSQENGNTAGTASNYFAADEWDCAFVTDAGAITINRDTAHPCLTNYPEIPYMLKLDCTTADATQSAGDHCLFFQKIEGLRAVGQLNWGAAGGKDLRVGFLCRADYTGTITVHIRNGTEDRSYVVDQAITADTDTWVSVVIPEDTTGTWDEGAGSGVEVGVSVACGSTFQGTNVTWAAGNFTGTSSTSNFFDTLNNTFWLGPMLVFPEDIPMPSDASNLHLFQRPYQRDLADCQRYYYKLTGADTVFAVGYASSTTAVSGVWNFPVPMRAAPTVSALTTASYFGIADQSGSTSDFEFVDADLANIHSARVNLATGTAVIAGEATMLRIVHASAYIDADARM